MRRQPSKIADPISLGDLIGTIEQSHHTYTRSVLARIATLLEEADPAMLPALAELRNCFAALRACLEPHMDKEEHALFPYIAALERTPADVASITGSIVARSIRAMRFEHITLLGLLELQRSLTAHYRPAAGSSPQVFQLFDALCGLDEDLVLHIHWEDNVLYPRAMQLEAQHAAACPH